MRQISDFVNLVALGSTDMPPSQPLKSRRSSTRLLISMTVETVVNWNYFIDVAACSSARCARRTWLLRFSIGRPLSLLKYRDIIKFYNLYNRRKKLPNCLFGKIQFLFSLFFQIVKGKLLHLISISHEALSLTWIFLKSKNFH